MLAALAAAVGFGWLVGRALYFTPMQTATLCLSCAFLTSWVPTQLGLEAPGIGSRPVLGVVLTGVFVVLLRVSFWQEGQQPRMVSLIITTLPAVPPAVASIVGLVWRS
jgi:hypothetical protein